MTANRGVRRLRLFPILLVLLAHALTVMVWEINPLGGYIMVNRLPDWTNSLKRGHNNEH